MADETQDTNPNKWITEFHNRYKLNTTFNTDKKCVVHTSNEDFLDIGADWLGTWEEVGVIGRGGFGSVWLEKEPVTGRQRAVKRILREKYRDIDLSRELKALIEARKCPDSFIQFFGWYENNRNIFLAMEYIEQGDLGQYLKVYGRQAEKATKEITRQLVVGLEFLHREQICHRDLKPESRAQNYDYIAAQPPYSLEQYSSDFRSPEDLRRARGSVGGFQLA